MDAKQQSRQTSNTLCDKAVGIRRVILSLLPNHWACKAKCRILAYSSRKWQLGLWWLFQRLQWFWRSKGDDHERNVRIVHLIYLFVPNAILPISPSANHCKPIEFACLTAGPLFSVPTTWKVLVEGVEGVEKYIQILQILGRGSKWSSLVFVEESLSNCRQHLVTKATVSWNH